MTTQAGTNFNVETIIFPSAARIATVSSADFGNDAWRGGVFTIDVTAASGTTPTLDVKLQSKDPASEKYSDVPDAAFAQITTAAGLAVLVVYPGVTETANVSVSDIVPVVFKFVATITGTTPSFTFSLGASLIK